MSSIFRMMNPRRSLRAEISLASGAVVLLLSTALSFYAADVSKQQIERSEGEGFMRRAQTALDVLDRGMYERSREIRNAALLDEMRDPKVSVPRKRELMERLQQNFDAYAWIGFCGPDAIGLVGTGGYLEGKDLSRRPWCIEGRQGDYIGDVHDAMLLAKLLPNPSGETFYLVDVASPVFDHKNNLLGVLCGHIYWSWASEALDSKRTPGQDIFLLSNDGKVLSGPEAAWADFNAMAPDTMAHIRSGAKNGYQIEQFNNGRTYLVGHATSSGYRDYKGFGWTAVVREDITTAFAPARALQEHILLVGALLGLFFTWLTWLMAGRIAGPIRNISLEAEKVAGGDLSYDVPPHRSENEVGHLSQAIHDMVDNLTREIKQRREAEAGLSLAAKVFEQNSEAIIVTDAENRIVMVNRAFSDITGYSANEVIGKNPRFMASGRQVAQFYRAMWKELLEKNSWRGEIWNKRKSGEIFPEFLTISTVRSEQGEITNFIGVFIDITERKLEEERITRLANYDTLSGLPNRNLLADRVEQAVAQAERHDSKLAMFFIDLDHFKHINDSLGHDIGDELLKQVSERLKLCLRRTDTLARQGGDEFIALITDIGSENEASFVADKMISACASGFEINGHLLHVTPSIGISLCPDDGNTQVQLMRNADLAMYRAKDSGRNRFAFYEEQMNRKAVERLRLENDLRGAIEQQQFSLYYQPKVACVDHSVVGMEALLRWQHPEFGFISPTVFIPVAEQTGLINGIGDWVLRQAVLQQRMWQSQGHSIVPVSVNLSVAQFQQADLVDRIVRIVREGGLEARYIELELTESMLMESAIDQHNVLNQLSAAGFNLALDDFGTGYSSLSRLKMMPMSSLKIDQSFVRDIASDANDRSIVSATAALAHAMGIKVVAEGVEQPGQLEFIQSLHCEEYQGFLFSPPLPAEEAVRFLK
ncbi:MAG: EAL domain-containing protein [Gammaproteobacteria bacterium]|nr:EAL domain-containing protein [Gammaproteobacteria bacterium]MBU1447088.1 EAL domain-containing protein [Gammaproteobacteria bacterium]